MRKSTLGFSLIELVAILVIVGVLGVSVSSGFIGNTTAQLQASRDSVVAALLVAQQRAMVQADPVRAVVGASQIDIQQYNGATWDSVLVGGTQYPLQLSPNQTITPTPSLVFDRLGRTSGTTLNLQQGSVSATIVVSASGFSQ